MWNKTILSDIFETFISFSLLLIVKNVVVCMKNVLIKSYICKYKKITFLFVFVLKCIRLSSIISWKLFKYIYPECSEFTECIRGLNINLYSSGQCPAITDQVFINQALVHSDKYIYDIYFYLEEYFYSYSYAPFSKNSRAFTVRLFIYAFSSVLLCISLCEFICFPHTYFYFYYS